MKRQFLIGAIITLVFCIVMTLITFGILSYYINSARTVAENITPTRTSRAVTAIPTFAVTPLASVSNETSNALANIVIPQRDLYQIVPRLKKNLALGTPAPTPVARARRVGDKDQFFVIENLTTGKYRSAMATLQVAAPHVYAWVEDGMDFDRAALEQSVNYFETNIYPTNQKYFGNVPPGIDGDIHINILNTHFPDAAGLFSNEDRFPRTLFQFSNQRYLIYITLNQIKPGTDTYSAVAAHEFQHLIHSIQAPVATTWIDEGMGDLAIKVNGFPSDGKLNEFGRNPNTQLNAWAEGADALPHYAASYLFFNYLAGRYSPDMIREVIHAPRESVFGIQTVLDQRANGIRFEDLFADWAVANYLNDPKIANGKYSYSNEAFQIMSEAKLSQYPRAARVQMHEYAAEYFSLSPAGGDVTIFFTGTTTVRLLPVDAHSGKWMWWSNRGDLSNMSITRAFDLSRAQRKATLNFWTWYEIEKNYDFGYVEVSTDGGKTWDILTGKYTTTENPNGSSYGAAFTGKSGVVDDKSPAQWVQEQMDLSAYGGKQILLRFEYITDDAFNLPSWAVDDITIPEINFSDDGEGGANGWDAKGFVRTDNVLPQKFIVQVVEKGNATRVTRLQLDDRNRGTYTLRGFGKEITQAELIVTPFAPVTTEQTEFDYAVVPQ